MNDNTANFFAITFTNDGDELTPIKFKLMMTIKVYRLCIDRRNKNRASDF